MSNPPVIPSNRKTIPVRTPRKPRGLTNFLGNVNFRPKNTVLSNLPTIKSQSFTTMLGGGGGGLGAAEGAIGARGAIGAIGAAAPIGRGGVGAIVTPGLGAGGSVLVPPAGGGGGGGGAVAGEPAAVV